MDNRTLWELTTEAQRAIFPFYGPLFERFAAEHGLTQRGFSLLLAAPTFEPDAVTPERLRVRTPYTAAEAYQEELEAVARSGFFVDLLTGEFYLTPAAHAEILNLIAAGRALMTQADPLPPADSARLASLAGRLARAALETPLKGGNWLARLNYRLMPPPEPPLPYFEQAVSCLHAHRDDAHLAAWRPSKLAAATLETLTQLWRGEADSLPAVYAKLEGRGHPVEIYAEAMEDLRARGFVEGPDSGPQVTESGKSFREKIEKDTDRFFFALWSSLAEAEKDEMAGLLARLRDELFAQKPCKGFETSKG